MVRRNAVKGSGCTLLHRRRCRFLDYNGATGGVVAMSAIQPEADVRFGSCDCPRLTLSGLQRTGQLTFSVHPNRHLFVPDQGANRIEQLAGHRLQWTEHRQRF